MKKPLIAFILSLLFCTSAFAASFETGIKSGLIKRNSIETEHFKIEFSDLMRSQEDSDGDGIADVIEVIAEAAEKSWDVIITNMGYERPIEVNSKLIVILDENGEYLTAGAVGITGLLTNGDPYVAVDPWQTDDYLRITLSHEFLHAVQFGYDDGFAYTSQGINWAEATATWMEDEVYNDVNDYINYLEDFFLYPDYSIFASLTPTDTLFEYALNIWPKFLSEFYKDEAIKAIWENYFRSGTDDENVKKIYESVVNVIEGDYKDELPEVFQEFTLWNLDTSQYEEGEAYPSVSMLNGEEGAYALIDEAYAPALYGTNYLYFVNDDYDDDFYFHLVKPDGISFSVTLVPYLDDNVDLDAAVSAIIDTDENFDDQMVLSGISDAPWVMAVVSPLEDENEEEGEVFDVGYLYYYLAGFGESLDDLMAAGQSIDDGTGEKDGESGTGDDFRDSDSLVLEVISYDESSVTFAWNRLVDESIAGYELWFGEQGSEYYDWYYEVDSAAQTHEQATDLEEGFVYDFLLIAVDENGEQIGDSSQNVTVTPMQWIFEDLSYLDGHYGAVATLLDEGIFEGYSDGTFRADNDINRAELLKILIEGRDLMPNEAKYRNCFPDVGTDWYAKYVCYAKEKGWIQGYPDGSFRPGNTVSKVEALKILFNVYEAGLVQGTHVSELPYEGVGLQAWYSIYIYEAAELGILEEAAGVDFNPENGRNRGDMAEELYRYLVVEGMLKSE